jgi:hypothetical protein
MGRKGDPGEMPPLSSLPDNMQKTVIAAGGKVPPLAGEDFLSRWRDRTAKDLVLRIKSAVGGFPPDNTSEETSVNLTAYILQVNGAKPGAEALTAATAIQIQSVATGTTPQPTGIGNPDSNQH